MSCRARLSHWRARSDNAGRSVEVAASIVPDTQGRVVLAGPLTDKTGSLIVIEADSLEDAQRFAREDPYTVHGVFERVEIHPFIQVFPKQRSLKS